jgi:hypothetical protein
VNIQRGYEVEDPPLFVPWGISEADLRAKIPSPRLRHVTDGYFTLRCSSLGSLEHVLGFHFTDGELLEFELFLEEAHDPQSQYGVWQQHLEASFGTPTESTAGSEGFPDHTWDLGDVRVSHFVFDRFGLEEHVRIAHARRVQLGSGLEITHSASGRIGPVETQRSKT